MASARLWLGGLLAFHQSILIGRRLGIVSCLREHAVNKFSELVPNAALLVSTVARNLRAESCPKSRVIAIPSPSLSLPRKFAARRQSLQVQAVSLFLEVKIVKATKVFPKAYYHGLLVQVEAQLDTLALVRFDGRLSIVLTKDLKETPYQVPATANTAALAAVSGQRF